MLKQYQCFSHMFIKLIHCHTKLRSNSSVLEVLLSRWGTPAVLHSITIYWYRVSLTYITFFIQLNSPIHYCDVMMGAMASQITSLTIVYSTVYSDADQIKHQSSAPLAFVRGIHREPVNSPRKGPVTGEMFPFDDVIMIEITMLRTHVKYTYWRQHQCNAIFSPHALRRIKTTATKYFYSCMQNFYISGFACHRSSYHSVSQECRTIHTYGKHINPKSYVLFKILIFSTSYHQYFQDPQKRTHTYIYTCNDTFTVEVWF